MTNHWVDIKNANLIIVMGANTAEAHPVGFKWVIEAKRIKQNYLLSILVLIVLHQYRILPIRPCTDIVC